MSTSGESISPNLDIYNPLEDVSADSTLHLGVDWFYIDDFGNEQGPFSVQDIRNWLSDGYLSDNIMRKGNSEHMVYSEWNDLKDYFQFVDNDIPVTNAEDSSIYNHNAVYNNIIYEEDEEIESSIEPQQLDKQMSEEPDGDVLKVPDSHLINSNHGFTISSYDNIKDVNREKNNNHGHFEIKSISPSNYKHSPGHYGELEDVESLDTMISATMIDFIGTRTSNIVRNNDTNLHKIDNFSNKTTFPLYSNPTKNHDASSAIDQNTFDSEIDFFSQMPIFRERTPQKPYKQEERVDEIGTIDQSIYNNQTNFFSLQYELKPQITQEHSPFPLKEHTRPPALFQPLPLNSDNVEIAHKNDAVDETLRYRKSPLLTGTDETFSGFTLKEGPVTDLIEFDFSASIDRQAVLKHQHQHDGSRDENEMHLPFSQYHFRSQIDKKAVHEMADDGGLITTNHSNLLPAVKGKALLNEYITVNHRNNHKEPFSLTQPTQLSEETHLGTRRVLSWSIYILLLAEVGLIFALMTDLYPRVSLFMDIPAMTVDDWRYFCDVKPPIKSLSSITNALEITSLADPNNPYILNANASSQLYTYRLTNSTSSSAWPMFMEVYNSRGTLTLSNLAKEKLIVETLLAYPRYLYDPSIRVSALRLLAVGIVLSVIVRLILIIGGGFLISRRLSSGPIMSRISFAHFLRRNSLYFNAGKWFSSLMVMTVYGVVLFPMFLLGNACMILTSQYSKAMVSITDSIVDADGTTVEVTPRNICLAETKLSVSNGGGSESFIILSSIILLCLYFGCMVFYLSIYSLRTMNIIAPSKGDLVAFLVAHLRRSFARELMASPQQFSGVQNDGNEPSHHNPSSLSFDEEYDPYVMVESFFRSFDCTSWRNIQSYSETMNICSSSPDNDNVNIVVHNKKNKQKKKHLNSDTVDDAVVTNSKQDLHHPTTSAPSHQPFLRFFTQKRHPESAPLLNLLWCFPEGVGFIPTSNGTFLMSTLPCIDSSEFIRELFQLPLRTYQSSPFFSREGCIVTSDLTRPYIPILHSLRPKRKSVWLRWVEQWKRRLTTRNPHFVRALQRVTREDIGKASEVVDLILRIARIVMMLVALCVCIMHLVLWWNLWGDIATWSVIIEVVIFACLILLRCLSSHNLNQESVALQAAVTVSRMELSLFTLFLKNGNPAVSDSVPHSSDESNRVTFQSGINHSMSSKPPINASSTRSKSYTGNSISSSGGGEEFILHSQSVTSVIVDKSVEHSPTSYIENNFNLQQHQIPTANNQTDTFENDNQSNSTLGGMVKVEGEYDGSTSSECCGIVNEHEVDLIDNSDGADLELGAHQQNISDFAIEAQNNDHIQTYNDQKDFDHDDNYTNIDSQQFKFKHTISAILSSRNSSANTQTAHTTDMPVTNATSSNLGSKSNNVYFPNLSGHSHHFLNNTSSPAVSGRLHLKSPNSNRDNPSRSTSQKFFSIQTIHRKDHNNEIDSPSRRQNDERCSSQMISAATSRIDLPANIFSPNFEFRHSTSSTSVNSPIRSIIDNVSKSPLIRPSSGVERIRMEEQELFELESMESPSRGR